MPEASQKKPNAQNKNACKDQTKRLAFEKKVPKTHENCRNKILRHSKKSNIWRKNVNKKNNKNHGKNNKRTNKKHQNVTKSGPGFASTVLT